MGLAKLWIAMGMIMVFSLAVISFMVGFAEDNEVAVDISSSPAISGLQTDTETQGSSFISTSNSSSEAYSLSTITTESETTATGGIFKNTPSSAITATRNIIKVGFDEIFGNDDDLAIVPGVLLSFLVILSFLYGWKVWKGGNPD